MASEYSGPIDPDDPSHGVEPVDVSRQLLPSFGAGLMRPTCHWLTERMGTAALLPLGPTSAEPHVLNPSIAGPEPEAVSPKSAPDDEGAAAIATLVALAAAIEAARAGPGADETASGTGSAPALQATFDPLPTAITAARPTVTETTTATGEDAPPLPTTSESLGHRWRWADARHFYPEAGLVLVAIALLGVWAYASVPHAPKSLPGPEVAQIRPEEADSRPASATTDARLKFIGREKCDGESCDSLLKFAPAPAPQSPDQAGSTVPYTTAAQSGADADLAGTQASSPLIAEPQSAAPAQNAIPPVASTAAADTVPEPEQIAVQPLVADPMEAEPVGTEPVLAAQEPPAAKLEQPATLSVAAPSAIEVDTGSIVGPSVESSAVVPEASPPETLSVELRPEKEAAADPQQTSSTPPSAARPAKPLPAPSIRKAQSAWSAKKSALAGLPKPSAVKAASAKPKSKASPTEKQTAAAGAAANKAPGFPPTTPSALIKPAKPAPPQAAANTPPAAATAQAGFAPGDKPPGFEIQTNLGGGFFAFQPY